MASTSMDSGGCSGLSTLIAEVPPPAVLGNETSDTSSWPAASVLARRDVALAALRQTMPFLEHRAHRFPIRDFQHFCLSASQALQLRPELAPKG